MKFPKFTQKDADYHGDYREGMTHAKCLATEIVGQFEDLLQVHDVPTFPSTDLAEQTEGMSQEERDRWCRDNGIATLYGEVYEDLVNDVAALIEDYLQVVKSDDDDLPR